MASHAQLKLVAGAWKRDRFAFGGSLLKGSHPKGKRIFSPRVPMHVVLKSSLAVGPRSLLRHGPALGRLLSEQARRHHVQLQGVSNAGNHLHLLLQAPSRDQLSAFLRAIAGRIAQLGQGESIASGRHQESRRFWDARPFSRLVGWGQDLRRVMRYLGFNATEAGFKMSREHTRAMFGRVQDLLDRGIVPRTPGLLAAGFD
jgi:REP element-mobilizing transposase RayT